MSTTLKLRIERLTDKLASVGLQGGDMTAELQKLAESEDLSGNEIRRVAESANRRVQLGLYKMAADKRFKFDLCDGKKVAESASKTAADETAPTTKTSSLLTAVEDAGGDPFAAPERLTGDLSVFSAEVDAKLAQAHADISDAELSHELANAREHVEILLKEAAAEEHRILKAATAAHDNMVQAAVNAVSGGVTLPSLYDAMIAGASGSNSSMTLDEATKHADEVMHLVIQGLKARGIENHKMGFRHNGDPDALSKLSAEDLIRLCKYHSSYRNPQDLTMADVKTAELLRQAAFYEEGYAGGGSKATGKPMRPDDALEMLKQRASMTGQNAVPQAYLDDADPLPNGQPRVFNTDSELIISVRDLVGAQDRMRRCHGAQEYLGLKLKKIEDAIGAVREARKTSELAAKQGAKVTALAAVDASKEAAVGAIAGLLGRAVGALNKPAVQVATTVAPMLTTPKPKPAAA